MLLKIVKIDIGILVIVVYCKLFISVLTFHVWATSNMGVYLLSLLDIKFKYYHTK